MRIRIVIDTEDADDPAAIETNTPFTLNVYADNDDASPSGREIHAGAETCLIGDDVAAMLEELAQLWRDGRVTDGADDEPLPRTGSEWRAAREAGEH